MSQLPSCLAQENETTPSTTMPPEFKHSERVLEYSGLLLEVESGFGSLRQDTDCVSYCLNERPNIIQQQINSGWAVTGRARFITGGFCTIIAFERIWTPVSLGAEVALVPVCHRDRWVVSPFVLLRYGANIWANGRGYHENFSTGIIYGWGIAQRFLTTRY